MPIESGDLILCSKTKANGQVPTILKTCQPDGRGWRRFRRGLNIEISSRIQMFQRTHDRKPQRHCHQDFMTILEVLLDNKAKKVDYGAPGNRKALAIRRPNKITGLPQITIKYDYNKIALYGINIADINKIIRSSFAAGEIFRYVNLTRITSVRRRCPCWKKENRNWPSDVSNLFIPLPNGTAGAAFTGRCNRIRARPGSGLSS